MKSSISQIVVLIGSVFFVLCWAITPLFGSEEQQEKIERPIVERFEEAQKKKLAQKKDNGARKDKKGNDVSAGFIPEVNPIVLENEETKMAMLASLKSYYEYRTKGFEHRKQVFAWQLFSAKIIFFVVIFLVLVGVYFSWVQFHKKMDDVSENHLRRSNEEKQEEMTTLSASAKEIKVSSPVLGVIILVISLLFFYLYLVYVFPIEEIF